MQTVINLAPAEARAPEEVQVSMRQDRMSVSHLSISLVREQRGLELAAPLGRDNDRMGSEEDQEDQERRESTSESKERETVVASEGMSVSNLEATRQVTLASIPVAARERMSVSSAVAARERMSVSTVVEARERVYVSSTEAARRRESVVRAVEASKRMSVCSPVEARERMMESSTEAARERMSVSSAPISLLRSLPVPPSPSGDSEVGQQGQSQAPPESPALPQLQEVLPAVEPGQGDPSGDSNFSLRPERVVLGPGSGQACHSFIHESAEGEQSSGPGLMEDSFIPKPRQEEHSPVQGEHSPGTTKDLQGECGFIHGPGQ